VWLTRTAAGSRPVEAVASLSGVALGAVDGFTWSTNLQIGSVYLGACVGLLVAFLARRPTGRTSDTTSARSESL
jgi:hypothetical protein